MVNFFFVFFRPLITDIFTAVRDMAANSLSAVRASLIDKCVDILAAYRKHCASNTSSGQIILPESPKLLPIYVLSLMKHPLLRSSNEVSPDDRAFQMGVFSDLAPALSTPTVYPRLYALHKLPQDVGVDDSQGRIILPTPQRLTVDYLEAEGVYLLENGHDMYLWLGRNAPPAYGDLCHEVLALAQDRSSASGARSEVLRVLRIADAIRAQRCKASALRVVRSREPLEARLTQSLVEDRAGETVSYVDFLVQAHKLIQGRLS